MQHNILRNSNITKIYLIYTDNGTRSKFPVKLRFMDNKECYFATQAMVNFKTPKRKIPAEIWAYTADGVYKTSVKLLDSTLSLNELMFEVSLPKTWDCMQLRSSSRKLAALPVSIKFNDGFEITSTTYDLSLGGFSLFYTSDISNIYKRFAGIATLSFPNTSIINFPNGQLITEVKFVREQDNIENHYGEKFFSFKFMALAADDKNILKNFLIKLD